MSAHAIDAVDTSPCADCGQVHDRCGGHRKHRDGNGNLVPCGGRPIKGTDRCRMHSGKSGAAARAAGARRLALAEARGELSKLGHPVEVDPSQAMLEMVYEAAGNVAVLRRLVQQLRHEASSMLVGVGDDDEEFDGRMQPAIAGRTGSAQKPNDAAPHVFVTMYDEERERLVRWSKMCRDAGVDERRVELAEQQGRALANVLRAAIEGFVAALVDAGVPADVVGRVFREQMPGIVRAALEAATARPAIETTSREQ